ncbi:phospholipase A1-IIgamma-like [Pyrus x bretschneideri]|uniref:phospholipase A1-IIgamma-like n=1 Tax=Pyrus x bretschneideri TaxID=225117 RepID=UPI00202E3760|nr:phospholipase A1-IIgamma-like [Pyrus x bretschneideri]
MDTIATRWRLLGGETDWEGLLDPLDIDLRRCILHYGERVATIGDSFISDPRSKNCGLPRYTKTHLFSKVGLENSNPYKYTVNKYIYAATEFLPGKSIWLGYVAVTTDEGKEVLGRRDILVTWRGTELDAEWGVDLLFDLVSASDILGDKYDPKVHHGFHSYYNSADPESPYSKTSCRAQVLTAIKEVVDRYKDEEISITVCGHSMGGAFAILNATDIVCNGYNKPTDRPDKACLVTSIVFASPRLGDQGFHNVFSSLHNLHVLRVTNSYDIVPYLPPLEKYVDVGKELKIDTLKSPYLKNAKKDAHRLEIYLHGVAGTQGRNGFQLVINRDIALVNKKLDGLKDEYNVIVNWWTEKNKSMVQMDDGSWVLLDHEKDDV